MARIPQTLIRTTVRVRSPSGKISGTGFGYLRPDDYNAANPAQHSGDDNLPRRFWYVTCAHVIDSIEHATCGDRRVCLEINETSERGGGVTTVKYPIDHFWTRNRAWKERCDRLGPIGTRPYTPEDAAVDVAVTTAPTHFEHWSQLEWSAFPPCTHLTKQLMAGQDESDRMLSEGDNLFLFGFPVGFYEDTKNWPTVRLGTVAQIQPLLTGKAKTFLIDGSVFGGNSGGPVVADTSSRLSNHYLVGMASGSRLNPKTLENADLGLVVPLDTINETIEMALIDSPHVSRLPKK